MRERWEYLAGADKLVDGAKLLLDGHCGISLALVVDFRAAEEVGHVSVGPGDLQAQMFG